MAADMHKFYFDYGIELSAEQLNQVVAYVTFQADQEYKAHQQEWDNETISGTLGKLSAEARAVIDQYRHSYFKRIQTAAAEENFDMMAFESAAPPEVRSICEKHGIQEDPRVFIR